MPATPPLDTKFQIGHVLFMDIVSYSKLMVGEQTQAVRSLTEVVQSTEEFRTASRKNKLVRIPTGDGMALVFRDSPESPVRCALSISRALRSQTVPLPVRMGVHSGLVHALADVNNRLNVAGAGINIAQRVMDCGDAGHILLSKHVAEDLEHHARWRPLLHDLGQCEVKHGVRVGLVNMFDNESGNPQLPETIRRVRKKRAATNVFVFGSTAALSLIVVAGSWLLSARYLSRDSADQPTAKTTMSPAASATPTIDEAVSQNIASRAVEAFPAASFPPLFSATPSQAAKLFAGTWRGTLHNSGPRGRTDSPIEFTIDPTESQWSNLNGGKSTRRGRTLSFRRSYRLGTHTNVYVHADLTVNDDGRTGTYNTGQVSVTGKAHSKTSGTATVEKVE